jgi:hypothetical protein
MRNGSPHWITLAGGFVTVVVLVQLLALVPVHATKPNKQERRFAASMAERGNWREAKYRWQRLDAALPDDPRILNNLGVASEALGEIDEAKDYYQRAYDLSRGDERIAVNWRRFLRSLEQRHNKDDDEEGEGEAEPAALPSSAKGKGKIDGKTELVPVGIPIPARLELEGIETVLVVSFRTPESHLLDVNRELVRYLRGKFRKGTALEVLDVVPPPAIPEQAIEDLIANVEFWRHLHREYEADLIVSGVVGFDRVDASRYEEVDYTNPQTGQKVRRTQFVEREEFDYALDVFFMEGPTGMLLFRDRVERTITFRGQMNDPITAFYELSDSIAMEVLAIVAPRKRFEPRAIFKN